MTEQPDEFRASRRAGGLAVCVAEPLEHATGVVGGGGGVRVGGVGWRGFEDEVGGRFGNSATGGGGIEVLVSDMVRLMRRKGGIVVGFSRNVRRRRSIGAIATEEPGFDERGFDVEGVGFVEHALHETFYCVLRRAVRSQARDAEGARGAAEDEVTTAYEFRLFWALVFLFEIGGGRLVTSPKVRQTGMDDVYSADEVGLELAADVVVILVLAGADDAVAGAVGDDVDAAEVGK